MVEIFLGTTNLIEDSGRVNIMLSGGTTIHITNVLYSIKFIRKFLSFKDIHRNGYHIETTNESNIEYLYITSIILRRKHILVKLYAFSSGLYHTTKRTIESHVVMN